MFVCIRRRVKDQMRFEVSHARVGGQREVCADFQRRVPKGFAGFIYAHSAAARFNPEVDGYGSSNPLFWYVVRNRS